MEISFFQVFLLFVPPVHNYPLRLIVSLFPCSVFYCIYSFSVVTLYIWCINPPNIDSNSAVISPSHIDALSLLITVLAFYLPYVILYCFIFIIAIKFIVLYFNTILSYCHQYFLYKKSFHPFKYIKPLFVIDCIFFIFIIHHI